MTGYLLLDDQAEPALAQAAHWIEGAVAGSLATSVALIAVALVGFGMLRGHVSMRRAMYVVLGCFLVFGAPAIALGLMAVSQGGAGSVLTPPVVAEHRPVPLPSSLPAYDPYAGAAVFHNRN